MAPSESFVMTVTKIQRQIVKSQKMLDKQPAAQAPQRLWTEKWERRQKFIQRAKLFSWTAFVSAHRSGVSLQPGVTLDMYALQLSHNWPESSRVTLCAKGKWRYALNVMRSRA